MPSPLKRFGLFLFAVPHGFIQLMSIVLSLMAKSLIRAYQVLFSPFFLVSCRFSPSCSQYALEAFQKHSPVRALLLSLKRVFKCHPWSSGGHDPVPN